MKIEAQGLRIADLVRVPMRGEGEVARREDFGREVRIWFRGSEDDPLPSVVFDATTILEVERPGSLFETPQQADRRELVRRVVEALERVGWTYHAANGESVDHLHDPAGLVRVEFQAELADHLCQCAQIRHPIEFRVRRAQQKVEIFREARQAMKDTEARAALKQRYVEEACSPEGIERNFLENFLDRIFLFEGVLRTILPQFFLDDVNHPPAIPEFPSSPRFRAPPGIYRPPCACRPASMPRSPWI